MLVYRFYNMVLEHCLIKTHYDYGMEFEFLKFKRCFLYVSEGVKAKHPKITYADLYQVIMIFLP